jgi:long-chain acyl-CoA synthetase
MRLNKVAICDEGRRITYNEVFAEVDKFENLLSTEKIARKHRQNVGLICSNSAEYIIISLGILQYEDIIVPIAPEHSTFEIASFIQNMSIATILVEKAHTFKVERLDLQFIKEVKILTKQFLLYKQKVKVEVLDKFIAINPAFIRFTSGTTGLSKGVVISHERIMERIVTANQVLRITENDNVIWVLSMSYHFAVTIILFLYEGCTITICPNGKAESIYNVMTEGTFIYASPYHYSMMIGSNLFDHLTLKEIRMAVSTTVHLTEKLAKSFFERFGIILSQAYGIIEIGLPCINTVNDVGKIASVGLPLPNVQVDIRNCEKYDKHKGIGEIFVKAPGMFNAYFYPWTLAEDLLDNGWFKTGDVGYFLPSGELMIEGRNNNVINFVGMKVFPEEIENVLLEHPNVSDALIYEGSHEKYGSIVMADIVKNIKTKTTESELLHYCSERLAQYKIPKIIRFVDYLPKKVSGKNIRNIHN